MPPRDDTHTDLVLGLQAGSTDAFERLYAEYHAAIYNLCARILCDREEAQDVTQDVFIKAFSRPPAADERLNLRAWLYRVATNACYNALRARTRHGGPGGETLDAVPAGVDEYERAQTAALVGQSLEQLNERYRTVLVLKDLHGLPPAEIAAVLQVSRPAADVLVHRARASFRSVFRRLAGRDATAPASLGLVLLPLSVPAALHVMPPLPVPPAPAGIHPAPHAPAGTAPHAPTAAAPHGGAHLPAPPDPSGLAGPGAVGLLSRLGDALGTKAAATAAAATLLVGGGLAVEHARQGGHDASAADAAVRSAGGAAGAASPAGHWSHMVGGDHHWRWAGHGIEADAHNGDHLTGGHDAAGHDAAHDGSTSTHDGDAAAPDGGTAGTHDTGGSTSTSGDHPTTSGTTHDDTSGAGDASGDAAHEGSGVE